MTLSRAPVRTEYVIAGTELEHVGEIRDLGIIIDAKLTFAPHMTNVVKRANRSLGLLIRAFQTGTPGPRFNKQAVICANFSNVRSILEYGSVIWAGAADTHTVRVDRVQHKFLIWLLTRTSSGHTDSLAYSNLLQHLRISSLSARRVQHDLLFIRNVFHSKLDSQNLLTSFSLHTPARSTRTIKLFHEICPRVNTVKGSLFCRMPRLVNSFLNSVPKADFFADSLVSFKNRVIAYIASL